MEVIKIGLTNGSWDTGLIVETISNGNRCHGVVRDVAPLAWQEDLPKLANRLALVDMGSCSEFTEQRTGAGFRGGGSGGRARLLLRFP